MSTFVEYLENDELKIAELKTRSPKSLSVLLPSGEPKTISLSHIIYEHRAEALEPLQMQIKSLINEIDVDLLWETLTEDNDFMQKSTAELAVLYFEKQDSPHCSAIFHALREERLHFKCKTTSFSPRTIKDIEELRIKLKREEETQLEITTIQSAFKSPARLESNLGERCLRWIKGQPDKRLERALEYKDPKSVVFWRLVKDEYLPQTADPAPTLANLSVSHPTYILDAAKEIELHSNQDENMCSSSFSIDDPETTEIDDALSARQCGEHIEVHIDIADTSRLVEKDSLIDLEALKRATSLYLPTATYYMLPPRLGSDLGSLVAQKPRYSMRTTLLFNKEGEVVEKRISQQKIIVHKRLDYDQADELIENEQSELANELRLLHQLALIRKEYRKKKNALILQRPEWKLFVDKEANVVAKSLSHDSKSRQLVSEMMIAANEANAQIAQENDIPLIFRTQSPPADALPPIDDNDPAMLLKLRGLIRPATLSQHPQAHWGLGLSVYCQSTSPLRRYADLLHQRQLSAFIQKKDFPYTKEDMLKMIANLDGIEQNMKRIEWSVNQRWALEHIKQGPQKDLPARIVAIMKTGLKIQILANGAEGLSPHNADKALGDIVRANVEQVKPRRGYLRLNIRE